MLNAYDVQQTPQDVQQTPQKEDRFCLHYQPVVAVSAEQVGPWYEALIRLIHETGELVLPSSFLPAAQRYNMMPSIDRWVIDSFFDA